MIEKDHIALPGTNEQLEFLKKNISQDFKSILVVGSASETIATSLSKYFKCKIELIVEDHESLINSKILLGNNSNINVSLMSFDLTDFRNEQFDLIYAQASISLINRNGIVKELKRILMSGGFFCVGEIVTQKKEYPQFIKDVFDSSSLLPLFSEELEKYYKERGFQVTAKKDFSNTLKDYYSSNIMRLKSVKESLSEQEKKYHKKLLNKISHESNVFLKLGGDKFIGFVSLILQKGES